MNGYLVVVSDLHLGGSVSTAHNGDIKEAIDRAVERASHVVYNGDIFEMFYRYKDKGKSGEQTLADARDDAFRYLRKQLEENPRRHIHFVLGNHEKIEGFRNGLEALQTEFANFEWHREAIKIGDALFTHGDLQMAGTNDHKREATSVKEAAGHRDRKTGIYDWGEEPGAAVAKWLRRKYAAAGIVYSELDKRAKDGSESLAGADVPEKKRFHFSEGKQEKLLDENNWASIKHVFFGHTHVGFTDVNINGKMLHNSGGTTRGFAKNQSDLRFIAAELTGNGLVDIISYKHYKTPKTPEDRIIAERFTRVQRTIAEGYGGI